LERGAIVLSKLTLEDCLHVLGLRGPVDLARARVAFLRLARRHHPDLKRSPTVEDHQRFVRIVNAYQHLKGVLRREVDDPDVAACPGCRRMARLGEGVDGVPRCLDCLLGAAPRRRFLPLPIFETVRHVGVMLLEAVTIFCIVMGLVTAEHAYVVTAGVSVSLAIAVLACTCIRVAHSR
jgi:hypothetical protein